MARGLGRLFLLREKKSSGEFVRWFPGPIGLVVAWMVALVRFWMAVGSGTCLGMHRTVQVSGAIMFKDDLIFVKFESVLSDMTSEISCSLWCCPV